jgi:uncharacterized membrane protein
VSARDEFLAILRAGLRGAPPSTVDDLIADYSLHFDEGLRAGRSEHEIAAALGDPLAMADELRAEAHVSQWERAPTARAGWRLVAHALSRGALHTSLALFAVPLLCVVALAMSLASLAALAGGAWFLFAGHGFQLPGGTWTVLLAGLGLLAGGVSLCALTLLGGAGLVNGFARRLRASQRRVNARQTENSNRSGASP